MSTYTTFISGVVNSFDENTEPDSARYLATFNQQQRYSTSAYQVKTYSLAAAATATFGASATDWRLVGIKVVGEITLEASGTDAASAAISSITGCYGVSIFPGWLVWTTANLTTVYTIRAVTASVVELYFATLAADT